MTVQEAKESIEYLKMQLTEDLEMICFTGDELKALDMSIQALEEVEQYRALGTVEEVTNQKHNLSVAYKCIEELQQPKADWIPCEVKDIIDTIISHNEIVALWVKEETEDVRYDKRIWRGMAWEIPKQYMGCKFEKIFGTVPESIVEADTINIRIETPQPYKKEGAEHGR